RRCVPTRALPASSWPPGRHPAARRRDVRAPQAAETRADAAMPPPSLRQSPPALPDALELHSLLVIEPEEPDGTGARMRSDDGAEVRDDLDLRLPSFTAHHLLQLPRRVGCGRVCDPDAQRPPVLAARSELVDEVAHRLLVSAHAL